MEIKYKDSTNKVHQIPAGFEHLMVGWPVGYTQITDEEAVVLNTTLSPTIDQQKAALQTQIDTIESGQRTAIREAVLNKPGAMGKLTAIDNQVVSLRAQKAAL